MAKIPRNLSDKDMFKGWKEEPTVEQQLLDAAAEDEAKSGRAAQSAHPGADIRIAYLTPDVIDTLGKMLLELKVELYREGIVDYRMDIRREGTKIVLEPKEDKKKSAKR